MGKIIERDQGFALFAGGNKIYVSDAQVRASLKRQGLEYLTEGEITLNRQDLLENVQVALASVDFTKVGIGKRFEAFSDHYKFIFAIGSSRGYHLKGVRINEKSGCIKKC